MLKQRIWRAKVLENVDTMHKGWKVIDENRLSIVMYVTGVKYPVNEWVEPKHGWGPLAVFKERYNANRFTERLAYYGLRSIIVPCEYKASDKQYLHNQSHSSTREPEDFPSGTVLAKRVRCLE